MSKVARAKKKLMTSTEMKKVVSATRVLLDAGLLSAKRATYYGNQYR